MNAFTLCWACVKVRTTNKSSLCDTCKDKRRCNHGHFGNCDECRKHAAAFVKKGMK